MSDDERPKDEDTADSLIQEMHAKTGEVADAHRSAADFDEDTLRKMDEIADRARSLRKANEQKEEVKTETRKVQAEDSKGLGLGFSVAYTLIGVPILGVGAGWLLDRALKSTVFMGVGAIVGMVIGIVLVILMVNKANGSQ